MPETAIELEFRDIHNVFQHKAVQDLYWVLYSPDLLAPDALTHALYAQPHIKNTKAWLESLDRDPTPLVKHLQKHSNTRLGKYFEALWQFFLQHYSDIKLCASNIQIHLEKRTLGEMDFVIEESSVRKHLELAVKFYLYVPKLDQGRFLEGWAGPNCNDFLDRKLNLLETKQLQLPYTENAKDILSEKELLPDSSELVMKGVLFLPYQETLKNKAQTNKLAKNHLQGTWLYPQQVNIFTKDKDRWTPLDKMDWLSPAFSELNGLNKNQVNEYIAHYFEKERRPLQFLVRKHNPSEKNIEAKEANERVFVVPADWPWVKA